MHFRMIKDKISYEKSCAAGQVFYETKCAAGMTYQTKCSAGWIF